MRVYLDTGGFMALFSEEGWKIMEKAVGEFSDKIIFCISPFVLEEFFFKIMYERKEKELIKRLLGIDEDDPSKRIDTFFRKYGSNFAQFLSMFESVGVEKDIIFLFANKEILKKLTKDVKTYDILHFLTALSNTMDGFLTTDKKFIKWLSKNKDLFKNEVYNHLNFLL